MYVIVNSEGLYWDGTYWTADVALADTYMFSRGAEFQKTFLESQGYTGLSVQRK